MNGVIHSLPTFITYGAVFITLILGGLGLYEDFHKTKTRRTVLWIVLIIAAFFMLAGNHVTDKQHQQDVGSIEGLQKALDSANELQRVNAIEFLRGQEASRRQFLSEFDRLTKRVGELQTEVKTADLQKQAAQLRADLAATRKAMEPPAKAELSWTFSRPNLADMDSSDLKEITATPEDGVIHVDVNIINRAFVDAIDGDFTLVLCDVCKFAKEPPNFQHLQSAPEQQRMTSFQRLLARTILDKIPLDINVPAGLTSVEIMFSYRCHTCIVPKAHSQVLIIRIKQPRQFPLIKPFPTPK